MKLIITFSLLLVFLLHYGECNGLSTEVNPCSDVFCITISLCWYDEYNNAQCENACTNTTCPENTYCITVKGDCGDQSCKPKAQCNPIGPPENLCSNIQCPFGQQCSVVSTLDGSSAPICGPNPCINFRCCDKSAGGICIENGCYLQKISDSPIPGQPAFVVPVCRDPCVVEQVVCPAIAGVHCYTDEVTCITAPCNPVPTCRKACESTTPICDPGLKCSVLQCPHVTPPGSYCQPIEYCSLFFPQK